MTRRFFRIHGDNIVECERTLKMISEAFGATYKLLDSPLYLPKYLVENKDSTFVIELLSGHGRWGEIDLGDIIFKSGGRLRESADSYLTEIIGDKEIVLLGIEYCSALPAGNNAWQRNGRAFASALSNIPYLYYAEIGGVELNENRQPKAPRYPNPVVPFSYVSLSHDMDGVCLPVYKEHPSMTAENRLVYESALGYGDGLIFIKQLIIGEDTQFTVTCLKNKAIRMVEILVKGRKKNDTLKYDKWIKLLNEQNRAAWLVENYKKNWHKKSSDKVRVSSTFKRFKTQVVKLAAVPIAANDLPFCIVLKSKLQLLKKWMMKTYKGINVDFDLEKDLALVWITGFKPKGDDSRPDRGLSPLCRMILGKDNNIMAVISGPGSKSTWDKLQSSSKELCKSNGLFEAIFTCCNYLFVDSATSDNPIFLSTGAVFTKNTKTISFPYTESPTVRFFEHDTDCAIHQIFSSKEQLGLYECFCNPPGGDWSGISYFEKSKEYKWTSLPRVSSYSKRPDHIFQIEIDKQLIFVPIESKGYGDDLEKGIGNRLKLYIRDLFTSEPTAYISGKNSHWSFFNGTIEPIKYTMISVGAFLFRDECELSHQIKRGELDAIFAFEFGTVTVLHFCANERGKLLLKYLKRIESEQGGFKVQVH